MHVTICNTIQQVPQDSVALWIFDLILFSRVWIQIIDWYIESLLKAIESWRNTVWQLQQDNAKVYTVDKPMLMCVRCTQQRTQTSQMWLLSLEEPEGWSVQKLSLHCHVSQKYEIALISKPEYVVKLIYLQLKRAWSQKGSLTVVLIKYDKSMFPSCSKHLWSSC
jgi:hypothetical protein